jgi:hypothetical protein
MPLAAAVLVSRVMLYHESVLSSFASDQTRGRVSRGD